MSGQAPEFIFEWTGRAATALQAALRMSNERFAEHLDVAVRTVAGWRAKPDLVPRDDTQDLLDTAYDRLTRRQLQRFVVALKDGDRAAQRAETSPVVMAAEMTLMQARIDELQAELARVRDGSL